MVNSRRMLVVPEEFHEAGKRSGRLDMQIQHLDAILLRKTAEKLSLESHTF